MNSSLKIEILNNRIQEIELSSNGIVTASDNALFTISEGQSIGDFHPFFEGVIPLFETISDGLKIPCVNLDLRPDSLIVDVEFLRKNDTLILFLFDLTEHYLASQPLVQEKNVASIAESKLFFEKQLLQAKEEFKNSFISNLNHEIRNPLNNLLGFMELLKETHLDYDQNEMLKVMQKTGMHIKVLMDDMLDISKIERGVLEIKNVSFNLGHLVNTLQNHFQLKYHDTAIEFEVTIQNNVPRKLTGDPARLNQILFNLLENAFRNTEKGRICLCIAAEEKTKKSISLEFTISDSGKGIPSDQFDKIFESYFQLEVEKLKPIGQGLGLKIVKDLTESLNGEVRVASESGGGSSFQCVIPFEIRKGVRAKKTIPKGSGIMMSKRILIVENDPTNQMLFMKTFLNNEKGYVIEIAMSAEHAMELLENNNYSMVMFKTSLPDICGEELIAKLKNHKTNTIANLPILIASGNTLRQEQQAVMQAGASAFLAKPYTKKELFKIIEELIS